jgi:hypothetical protein
VSCYCLLLLSSVLASNAVKQGVKKAAEKAEEVDRSWASREKAFQGTGSRSLKS